MIDGAEIDDAGLIPYQKGDFSIGVFRWILINFQEPFSQITSGRMLLDADNWTALSC